MNVVPFPFSLDTSHENHKKTCTKIIKLHSSLASIMHHKQFLLCCIRNALHETHVKAKEKLS